jgi:hypothetical protein
MAMDYGYFWFRFTQVATKVSPIIITLFLLAPLAVLFWRVAKYQPKSEAETRAELEQLVREQLAKSEAEIQAGDAAAQAQKEHEFAQMLEQAKKDGPSIVLSGDGTVTDLDGRIENLESYIRSASSTPASGSLNREMTMVGTTVTTEERVSVTPGTAAWFSLYPRRWVGLVGLSAVALILGLVVWSALVPARPPVSMSGSLDASGMQIDGGQEPVPGGKP